MTTKMLERLAEIGFAAEGAYAACATPLYAPCEGVLEDGDFAYGLEARTQGDWVTDDMQPVNLVRLRPVWKKGGELIYWCDAGHLQPGRLASGAADWEREARLVEEQGAVRHFGLRGRQEVEREARNAEIERAGRFGL